MILTDVIVPVVAVMAAGVDATRTLHSAFRRPFEAGGGSGSELRALEGSRAVYGALDRLVSRTGDIAYWGRIVPSPNLQGRLDLSATG